MTLVRFRIRRDTAANWTSVNPTLALGEPGLETDTRKVKYGDGSTAWNDLDYASGPLPSLGTLATQDADDVNITGGAISGVSSVASDRFTIDAAFEAYVSGGNAFWEFDGSGDVFGYIRSADLFQWYIGGALMLELGSSGSLAATGTVSVGSFTVATMPVASAGVVAYASNGRKVGEGSGAGTGVMAYSDGSAWRRFSDDTVLAA